MRSIPTNPCVILMAVMAFYAILVIASARRNERGMRLTAPFPTSNEP